MGAPPRRGRGRSGRQGDGSDVRLRTAECAVGGFRVFYGEPAAASLLLGVHDAAGALRHVGVASSFARDLQYELFSYLRGAVVPLDGHPWQHGFGIGAHFANRLPGAPSRWTSDMALDWIPVGPDLVCEVAYDHWDGDRFRYPTRWRRWRPDRTSRSCTLEQFDEAGAISFDALHDLRDELEALPGQGAEIEYAAGR